MFASIEEAHQIFSDIQKDAYGHRLHNDTSSWTLEDYNNEYKYLRSLIEERIRFEDERKAEATKEFTALVETCKKYGAKDDAEAVRWLLQSDGVDSMYDVEYWMYNHDISYTPYGNYIQAIITSNQIV